jgi:CheY-like chemotaxis protein
MNPLILVVHADAWQIAILRQALAERIRADVAVVSSRDAALAFIKQRLPDIILVHAFMARGEQDDLAAHLRSRPYADHVNVVRIPVLDPFESSDRRIRIAEPKLPRTAMPNRDPRAFASRVAEYLSQARARKAEAQSPAIHASASDRRRALRWKRQDVPWVSSVQLAPGDAADLINLSWTGALIRTPIRPVMRALESWQDLYQSPSSVTFHLATGQEITAPAQVMRCEVESLRGGGLVYGVAFRFREAAPIELPSDEPISVPESDDSNLAAPDAPDKSRAELRSRLFDDVIRLQRVLPKVLATNSPVSSATRTAISELTVIDKTLIRIRESLAGARRTHTADAHLSDILTRLAPRIQELRALRDQLIESITDEDVVLIAGQAGD